MCSTCAICLQHVCNFLCKMFVVRLQYVCSMYLICMCNVCMRWEKHMMLPCECLGTAMRSSYYAIARENDLAHSLLAVMRGFSSVAVT